MSRVVQLVVLALLMGGIVLAGEPDPVRLAAAQLGSLLREPARLPPEVDWRAALVAGDRVEHEGRTFEVLGTEGERVTLAGPGSPADAGDPRTVPAADLARLVEKCPLWRYLIESPVGHAAEDGTLELWVRGYRMDLSRSGWKDVRLNARAFESVVRSLRSIAAEQDFDFRIVEKNTPSYPGLVMFGHYDDASLSADFTLPDGSQVGATRPWSPPGRSTLLPSLLAILAAVLFRRPLLALLCGVLAAALIESRQSGATGLASLVHGTLGLVPQQLADTLGDPAHLTIMGFLAAMLAMVGILQHAGGMRGLMALLARWARSPRSCQAVTYLMGLAVFFDHYANTVLVGATMRPISDRFRIAREKLAYIVDSTAAPVAGLSLFSTWIAFEVSAFRPHLPDAGLGLHQGYEVFLRTLPYRFYSLFTLLLVGLVVATGRDFGPMLRAERRARGGQLLRAGARLMGRGSGSPDSHGPRDLGPAVPRARTALRPLCVFIAVTLASTLLRGGLGTSTDGGESVWSLAALQSAMYRGSGSTPLLLGSLAGLATAVLEAWAVGLRRSILGAAWGSVRSASTILALLCLAWMFGALCLRIGTATFLAVLLQEGPNPLLLPVILFGVSALVAFATGSSWSTMTILLPLVVGLAYEAGPSTPVGAELLVIITIGSVLEGAIFGDHCSPIADSTIMSSIATQSDHVDHVRTQAPYALLAMVVAITCGYLPVVFLGLSPLWSLAAGTAALTGFLLLRGGKVLDPGTAEVTARVAAGSGEGREPADDERDPGGGFGQLAA